MTRLEEHYHLLTDPLRYRMLPGNSARSAVSPENLAADIAYLRRSMPLSDAPKANHSFAETAPTAPSPER